VKRTGKKTSVALLRCRDYRPDRIADCLKRQFDSLGGLDRLISPGDSVLLKPNFIAPKRRSRAVQTDPEVILQTAKMLKDFGAKPFVADSPAWSNVFACVKVLKLDEPLKKLAVPVKQLDKPEKCRLESSGINIGISTVALRADKIINLSKFKTHQQLVTTFAVKNMFGCVSGKAKAFWHFRRGGSHYNFCKMLIEIYKFLSPVVTIIDAVVAMEGTGPIRGRPRPLGWLIAGYDPIACEIICADLINVDPDNLPMIRTARQLDFGAADLDEIEILGDDYKGLVCTDFKPAEPAPLRFSLLRVCKSLCKQILLLARSFVQPGQK